MLIQSAQVDTSSDSGGSDNAGGIAGGIVGGIVGGVVLIIAITVIVIVGLFLIRIHHTKSPDKEPEGVIQSCELCYNIHIPQSLISDHLLLHVATSNCRKVESVKWSKVAKSEFVVSECAAYGTAPQEVEEDQYYVVPDPAVPEYYVVPDPAVPEYLYVVPDPAVPEYLYVVPDPAVPEATNQPEEAYEVPDAVPETINRPQETKEAVYEWIPGDPQQ